MYLVKISHPEHTNIYSNRTYLIFLIRILAVLIKCLFIHDLGFNERVIDSFSF